MNLRSGVLILLLLIHATTALAGQGERIVVDQRDVAVKVPRHIQRVVTISDGLAAYVMTALGVADRIVGLGSSCIPRHWEYVYPDHKGDAIEYRNAWVPAA